jgi:photosystem II stability/assembly factor-like uncharacterized protein
MTPEERELRRALDSRSGELSADYQTRLAAVLKEGRPASNPTLPAVAVVIATLLTIGTVAVLISSRHASPPVGRSLASGARLATPTPSPIFMPSTAQLSAPSSNVVWALVADTRLFRSTDQGNTWVERSMPQPPRGGGWKGISFVDDQMGWMVYPGVPETQCNGAGAEVWRTIDGAATWQMVALVDWAQPHDTAGGLGYAQCKEFISFVDATHGFLAAWDDNHSPTIYRTADGGKTWTGSTLPDPPDFKTQAGGVVLRAGLVKRFGSTLFVEASGMQEVDRAYVFRSTDGGATWSWVMKIPSRYIVMLSASRWLQLIWPGQSMESTNGGQQWHPYASDFSSDTPVGGPQIVFADSQVGYAEGRGALQRTVDGGLHWVRLKTPGVAEPG